MAGNVYHAFAQPQAKSEPAQATGLTTRELEILRLVAAGASNSTIGAQLWITEQTVKFHLSNVYRKLGVANRTQASRFAYLNGLIEPVPANGARRLRSSRPPERHGCTAPTRKALLA